MTEITPVPPFPRVGMPVKFGVIVETFDRAQELSVFFRGSREIAVYGLHAKVAGLRFDNLIFGLTPSAVTDREREAVANWQTRLTPNGKVLYL